MDDLKVIFAQNLMALRKQMKLTQAELAEKINYSDKAVSKWERGESIPDVSVLLDIARLFGVDLDFLVTKREDGEIAREQTTYAAGVKNRNRKLVASITFFAILFFETAVFLVLNASIPENVGWNLTYCYLMPLPALAIVAIVFASLWAKRYVNFAAVSLLIWSLLLDAFLIIVMAWKPFAWVFVLGVPAEIIAMMSFKIRILPVNKDKKTNASKDE